MRTCPFCSTENEAFFRFCLGCGADLDEALGPEDEAGDGPAIAAAAAVVDKPVPAQKPEPVTPESTASFGRGTPARTPDPTAAVAGRPRGAGPTETSRAAARPYVSSKDTAVDVPAISAETLAALKGEKPLRAQRPAMREAVVPPPVPERPSTTTGSGMRPSVSPAVPSARVSRDREKTLEPGGAVKPGSPASQAVAQAQLESRRQVGGPTEQLGAGPAALAKVMGKAAEAEAPSEEPAKTKPAPMGTGSSTRPRTATEIAGKRVGGGPESGEAPRPLVAKRPGSAPIPKGRLVIILEDGTDGSVLELAPETTLVGREGVDISFPHDDFLAKRHAELTFSEGILYLRPLESTNGVFLQVHTEVELETGDVFRIGQQLLCFEVLSVVASSLAVDPKGHAIPLGSPLPEGAWGRLGQLIAPDTFGSVYLLGGSEVYLGRERGDITFPGDGFVSGLHAQISMRNGRCFLKDLGSSNGTYLRLTKPTPVRRGMLVLAGQQLFRVET